MPSIYDIAEDYRLRSLPVPPKPGWYRCSACEEEANPTRDYTIYERYEHNYDCGHDNYAHIIWDYRTQQWVKEY